MKIKTKKQLNLPQLIEWGFENDATGTVFSDDRVEVKRIRFEVGIFASIHGDIHKGDTFTVEVEEEITEDTVFKSMVEVTTDDLFAIWECASISTWKNEHSKEFHAYIDGEFKLIWRDGKLVE
jgi:ketopantoate reductase